MNFLKTSLLSLVLSAALIPQQSYSQIVRIPFAMGAAQVVAQNFAFGDVQVGQYVTTTFTYKNGSPLELTILGTTSDNVDLIGSDCPTTLAAQDVCHITIGMLVTEEGFNQGQVRIKNNQNVEEDVLNVTANGVTTGTILTVDPAMQLFSIVNQEQEFTVTNNQVYDITIGNVLMSNNYWTISKNACIGTLTAGNSCKVSAKYVNKKTGGYTGILKVLSQSVMVGSANLSGNTALGVPSFSSDSISAQDLKINEIYQNSVVLKNSGVGGMIINSVGLDAPTSAFSLTTNSCSGKTLAPNETCNVSFQIQFTAPDVLQRSLVFNLSNSSTSAAYLNVYASAVANTAILNPMPGSLNFGPQSKTATSSPLTVNLQSIGTSAVNVTDIYIIGKDAALFSLTNKASCIGSLSPEMQCPLTVVYGPSNAVGNHSASIGFTSDATSPTNPVVLTGVTVSPTISATPNKVSFTGTIGVEQFQTVSITNTSSVETVLGAMTSDNANISATGSGCTKGATLNAGESCSLKVTLKNTAPIGSQTNKITVTHSGDVLNLPVDYNLSAFKIDPIVSEITCPTVSRSVAVSGGPTPANAADYCSFTVKNPSAASPIYIAASGVSKTAGSSLFSNASTLSSTMSIDPGATVTVKIPYQVSATAGSFTADYNITSSTNLSIPANSSSITKTATLNVLAESYELSAVSCPGSVSLGSSVNCTARLSNKSLSAYSLLIPYAPKNLVYAAAKFSDTTLNGSALSSIIADRPVDDFSPTATNFRWVTSVTGCSAGSAASVGVANSGYCDLSIVFNPTKVGAYVVPLYGIWGNNTTNSFKGNPNALFSVVETATGSLSNVTCPRITVGSSANCTATLTNPSSQTSLSVTGLSLTPDASGTFSNATSNCGSSVAAGSSCTITIPANGVSAGNFTGTLSVTTSAGPYTATANIVVDLATPAVSISAISCPTVIENEATTCSTTIKNNGSLPYNISSISLAKTNIGFGAATSSNMNLATGAEATISVPFVNAVAGTYTSAVNLVATGYTDLRTNITAIVNAAPAAVGTLSALACSSLSFGQSGLCTATLKNTSSIKSLAVGAMTVTGNNTVFGSASSNCGASLSTNASCTVSVPVSGAVVGSYPVTLAVVTNPNLSQSSNITISPLVFSVTAAPSANTVSGSPVTLKTVFTNKNLFNVTIPTGSITLSGTGYKIVTNACENVSLAVDQTCYVDVSYAGSVTGTFKGSLTLKYGGATVVGDLNTFVSTPSIGIAPLDGVTTKASGFRSLSGTWYIVSNSNPIALTIGSISMANASSTAIALQSVAGSCYVGQTLQPNEQCFIFERYSLASMGTNASVVSTNTGTVKSTTNVSAAWSSSFTTQRGALTIDKASAVIAPTDTYTGSVTFTNSSASPVKNIFFSRTSDSSTGVFTLGSGNCTGVVASGATCTQSFSIQGLAAGTTVVGLAIQGTYQTIVNDKLTQDWGESTAIAVAPAKVTLTITVPTGLVSTGSYGNGTTATSIFTNKSGYPVTVTGVELTNATDQSVSGSTCVDSVVIAGGTCEITTTKQSQSGDLEFVRAPATLKVTVNGQYPFSGTIVSSPVLSNSINFGEIAVGATSTKSFTLQNTTSGTITFSSVVLPPNVTRVSSVVGDCSTAASFSLTAGQSCVMRVSWKPQDEEVLSDVIKLISNYGGGYTATVATTGNAIIPVGTIIHANGCGGDHVVYDSVHGQIVTGMSSGSITTTSGGYVNGYVLPSASLSTSFMGAGYDYSQLIGYAVGGPESSIKAGATAQCYLFSVNPNNQYNVAKDDAATVKATSAYTQSVYSAEFDGYVRIVQQQGSNVDSQGLNYITPPIKYLLSFKPRGSAAPVVFFNNVEPFATKGSYYSKMKLMASNDQSVVYISYVDMNDTFRMYRFNLNSSNGLAQLGTTPYFSPGSEPSAAPLGVSAYANPVGYLTYTFHFGGNGEPRVDPINPAVIWATGPEGLMTYNTSTGAITKIKDNNGASIHVGHNAMDVKGVMYYASRRDGNSPYTVTAFDTNSKTLKTLATLPKKSWAQTVATIHKLIVSKDNRYLYLIGQGYWSKIKINP